MTAIALVAWAAVLINFCVTAAVVIGPLCFIMYFGDLITGNPVDRAFRERRRHARRTARAMREMSEIRRKTIERMDRAEEEARR
jgi:hypothetical protein